MSVSSTSSPAVSKDRVFSPDDFRRERRPVILPPQSSRFKEREKEREREREWERDSREREVQRQLKAEQPRASNSQSQNRPILSLPTEGGRTSGTSSSSPANFKSQGSASIPPSLTLSQFDPLQSVSEPSTATFSPPSQTATANLASSPSSSSFPTPLKRRISYRDTSSNLQEEAAKEWAAYKATRGRIGPPTAAGPGSSLTKSLLSSTSSLPIDRNGDDEEPNSTDRGGLKKGLHLGDKAGLLGVNRREEAIESTLMTLDRRARGSSSSSSLRSSSSFSRTKEHHGVDSENEEAEESLLPTPAGQVLRRASRRCTPSRASNSSPMGRSDSQPSYGTTNVSVTVQRPRPKSVQISSSIHFDLGLPVAKYALSPEEKREQLRRNQKLARVLGEEVLVNGENNFGAEKKNILRRIDLNRRKSDSQSPELPSYGFQSSFNTGSTSQMDSKGLRRRSRSVIFVEKARAEASRVTGGGKNLLFGNSSAEFKDSSFVANPTSHSQGPNRSLPADIHPKAAAILGLNVTRQASPLSRRRSLADTLSIRSPSVLSLDFEAGSSLEAPGRLTRDGDSSYMDLNRAHASIESDIFLSISSEDKSMQVDDEDRIREERRKKVAKLSSWLGSVVPVQLVYPDTQLEPMDLDHQEEETSTPSHGKGRAARVAALNKLKSAAAAAQRRSDSPSVVQQQLNLPNGLSDSDRIKNVKRANKLANVFGEAPPQQLFARKGQHAHSFSEPGQFAIPMSVLSKPPERPMKAAERGASSRTGPGKKVQEDERALLDSGSSFVSLDSDDSGSAYRQSISSLEYLLDNDVNLLSELVSELDAEDRDGGSRAGLNSTSGTSGYFANSVNPFDDSEGRSFLPGYDSGDDVFEPSTPTMMDRRSSDQTVSHDSLFALQSTSKGKAFHDLSENQDFGKEEGGEGHQLSSSASILSIDSSIAQEDSDDEHEARRQRALRAKKLNKFFGEAPPLQKTEQHRRPVQDQMATPTKSQSTSSHPIPLGPTPNSLRKRLAPRSAGTATPAASFARLLGNLEDEVLEDESLGDLERREIADKVAKIKRKGKDLIK